MNDQLDNKKNVSTPERKRDYINKWLEDSVKINANPKLGNEEKTPPTSPQIKVNPADQFLSPVQKNILKHQTSPVLIGKRPATSPIIGGFRKISKKSRLLKKKSSQSLLTKSNILVRDKGLSFVPTDNLRTDLSQCNKSSEHVKKEKYSTTFKHLYKIEETSPLKKVIKNFTELFNDSEDIGSQLIESVSSDNKSIANSETIEQEIKSETSKTASDLIEDLYYSQLDLETSHIQKPVNLSQDISNPTSNSSEEIDDIENSSKPVSSTININQQFTDTLTQVDPIDSISTLDTRLEFSKTSYILQCSSEKQKKKKNFKKGSLLDILISTIGKEKSSVNLLRHQIHNKTIIEKPFILLQIVQHLSTINCNQFIRCILIEDTANLLNGFNKRNDHQFITVINTPEISASINVNHKPVLKIYEPWTIMDHNQLVIHITRFIAIPANETKICDETFLDKNQVIYENYCSCLDKKTLSNLCQSKLEKKNQNMLIKKIVDYS